MNKVARTAIDQYLTDIYGTVSTQLADYAEKKDRDTLAAIAAKMNTIREIIKEN